MNNKTFIVMTIYVVLFYFYFIFLRRPLQIKIDKGFIDAIENPKSRSILRHTVQMLKELDLDIIVEGVENEAQKDFLLECGCTNAQGYLYYKPMPVDKFEKLLDEGK